ncbi:MAG: S9 family peptidase [Gammaproteobacteria bacterium]
MHIPKSSLARSDYRVSSAPALVILALASAVCAGTAVAVPPEAPTPLFEGRNVFDLQWASDPQIRPDGRSIAYVRNSYEVMKDARSSSIWIVDSATGEQTPLVGSAGSPRWSSDGTRLAYISSGPDGRAQIHVRWQNGVTSRLADLTSAPDSIAWSHDGRSVAFILFQRDEGLTLGSAPPRPEGAMWAAPLVVISDVTYRADGAGQLTHGYSHAFVVSSEGGMPRQLTFGAFNHGGPISWSADDKLIYLSGNRTRDWERDTLNTEVYEVNVASAAIRPLTTRQGPDNTPLTSPDGSKIAWLTFEDKQRAYENTELYVMDSDGGNFHSLTKSLDRSIDNARWAADGRGLFIQYVDHSVVKVARVSLDGRVTPVASGLTAGGLDRPYSLGEFSAAKNGAVAFTSGTVASPADISIAIGGRTTQLTHLNAELFRTKTLATVEPLAVKSSADQRPVDAWLVKPPAFDASKKYPLILEIHGGPFVSYGRTFSTDYQLFAAGGYVVLYANPRGSTSYGAEFAKGIDHSFPGVDYDDLMSATDAAVATGFVDADNLFVTGGSGGGLLTAWIVGKTERFRAAAAQKPIINWMSLVLTTDDYVTLPRLWFGRSPWESEADYWRRSPLSLVENVKTPTLLVVGEQDMRTPMAESEQFYQALQLRGIPTALLKVPGASHGGLAGRPSQSAARVSAIMAWFERFKRKS